jgi:8-oxo-dGTP pyrophosphatase MutT (NUDIX family)
MYMKMSTMLRDMVGPMFRRPKGLQVAALCHRNSDAGKQVLLITSRGTGRWIIPKGWPIRGLGSAEAAVQEAWEEAGVKDARAETRAIGSYNYDKTMDSGLPLPIETLVYSVEVGQLADDFPERSERRRKWVSPQEAALLVDEPELKTILRELDEG